MVPDALSGRAAGRALKWVARIGAAALLAAAAVVLAVPLRGRAPLRRPAAVHGRAEMAVRADAPVAVGAAKATIEVPRGAPLGGHSGFRRAAADAPVYARALAFEAGGARAVIASIETLVVPGELEEEVLRRAQLPPRTCLLLAASHTHSGPGGTWKGLLPGMWGNGQFDAAMRDGIAQAAADAIRASIGYLRSGRMAVARFVWEDGPAVIRSAGPIDPTLTALQARDEAGVVIGTLVVYGMHPTVLPPRWATPSGDWPGAAARAIEDATEAPALVLQGAGGNATWSREGLPVEPEAAARALGDRVARRALDALSLSAWTAGAGLSCSVKLAALPRPQGSPRVPWLLRRAAGNLYSLAAEPFAVETEVGLGGLLLRGVPGEPVGAMGLSSQPAQLIGLADGYVGYVEDPGRTERGEGEAARTYYGPGLARALDLQEAR